VYTPRLCILDSVYSTRRSVEGKHDGQVRQTTLRLRKAATIARYWLRQFCDISLAYGRIKSDYMYNESFSTSRLLIMYAALVTVLFLPHCPPLPHRTDMSAPAFSTPPFLTVPFCPLPQIPSTLDHSHEMSTFHHGLEFIMPRCTRIIHYGP